MDLEKLNKSQIVLLTLLVSFMTSIATGIVTVALMEEAPPVITETVNRVVERTVEKVVTGQVASAAEPVVKTVIVQESQLIPQAVEAASPSIVRIYSGNASSSVFLGLGLVIGKDGLIVTDSSVVSDLEEVSIELSGSRRVDGRTTSRNDTLGLSYLMGATSTETGPVSWKSGQLSGKMPSLGQTVVLITGRSAARLAEGLTTSLAPLSDGVSAQIQIIETDIDKDVIMPGSPIIDTSGTILGITTSKSRATNESGFLTAAALLTKEEKPAETE